MKKLLNNRQALFSLLIILLTAIVLVVPSPFESAYVQNVDRQRAVVVAVDDSNIQQFGIIKQGEQIVQVRIETGELKGQILQAVNILLGKMETDKIFQIGDECLVVIQQAGGVVTNVTAYDHYRADTELILLLLFGGALIAFAGWGGLRALLSFAFAIILIWRLWLPAILDRWDPIIISLLLVAVISVSTLCLVSGVNRRALVAILGALLGIGLTCALAILMLPTLKLSGAIQPYSETLLYSGFADLDLNAIFVAAVFVGASGGVMDIAIDVSASMAEVIRKRPDLSRGEMIKSGFEVGRAMTSTMVTTLLMAYISGYMALLMLFMAQGTPPLFIINTNYVTAEIVKTLVGSFGLVTVAPFTALVGGFLFVSHKPAARQDQDPSPNMETLSAK